MKNGECYEAPLRGLERELPDQGGGRQSEQACSVVRQSVEWLTDFGRAFYFVTLAFFL